MESVSDIMKKEIESEQREWNEMRFAVPVLRRVLERLDDFLKEEKEGGNICMRLGLFLAIKTIESEIKKLEGKSK